MHSAGFSEVQEKPKAVLLLPGVFSKVNPFNSPAQLSDISTVADWCSEADEDVREWQSDIDEADSEGDLRKNFPTLQAFFDKKVPVNAQVQEWKAVGGRFSLALSSCTVDSDDDDLPKTPVIKESIKAWSTVGSRLSSAFMKAAEEEDDV
jgi:hypothetical protein